MNKIILTGNVEDLKDFIYSINHNNRTTLLETCKKLNIEVEE